ncbi:MAG: hypothetical protein DSY37_04075 [Hyperthermus sp.]|nr:MAG: hypothetical protein DSY37_04075 [Hyperthermus sp.]
MLPSWGRIVQLRRRIQVTGHGSYIVTLPKEWIKLRGLEKGSEIIIVQDSDGSLRIIPSPYFDGSAKKVKATISSSWDSLETILRRIISYYIAGADVLVVNVERGRLDSKRLAEIVSRRLMGVEVVEESSTTVVFHVIASPFSMQVIDTLKKLARTVGFMIDDLRASIARRDKEMLREIVERDDIVDKLFIYMWRQITLMLQGRYAPQHIGLESYADSSLIMMAAKNIERIGDHASRIAKAHLKGGGLRERSPLLEVMNDMKALYEQTVDAFLSPSPEEAERLIAECSGVRQRLAEVAYGEAAGPDRIIVESLSRMIDYCVDILELTLNRSSLRKLF